MSKAIHDLKDKAKVHAAEQTLFEVEAVVQKFPVKSNVIISLGSDKWQAQHLSSASLRMFSQNSF